MSFNPIPNVPPVPTIPLPPGTVPPITELTMGLASQLLNPSLTQTLPPVLGMPSIPIEIPSINKGSSLIQNPADKLSDNVNGTIDLCNMLGIDISEPDPFNVGQFINVGDQLAKGMNAISAQMSKKAAALPQQMNVAAALAATRGATSSLDQAASGDFIAPPANPLDNPAIKSTIGSMVDFSSIIPPGADPSAQVGVALGGNASQIYAAVATVTGTPITDASSFLSAINNADAPTKAAIQVAIAPFSGSIDAGTIHASVFFARNVIGSPVEVVANNIPTVPVPISLPETGFVSSLKSKLEEESSAVISAAQEIMSSSFIKQVTGTIAGIVTNPFITAIVGTTINQNKLDGITGVIASSNSSGKLPSTKAYSSQIATLAPKQASKALDPPSVPPLTNGPIPGATLYTLSELKAFRAQIDAQRLLVKNSKKSIDNNVEAIVTSSDKKEFDALKITVAPFVDQAGKPLAQYVPSAANEPPVSFPTGGTQPQRDHFIQLRNTLITQRASIEQQLQTHEQEKQKLFDMNNEWLYREKYGRHYATTMRQRGVTPETITTYLDVTS